MHRCWSVNRSLQDGDCFHVDGAVRARMALSRMPGALTQPVFITDLLDCSQATSSSGREPPRTGWTVQQQVSVVGAGSSY